MEPHFTKPLQNNNPRLNSLNSSNTLSGSHLGLFEPVDVDDNSSPVSDSTALDNCNSDCDNFLEEGGAEQKAVLNNSLRVSSRGYTHWAEPWTGMAVQKPLADNLSLGAVEERKSYPDWTDTMPSTADLQIKPSVSTLPPYYRSLHSVVIFFVGQ